MVLGTKSEKINICTGNEILKCLADIANEDFTCMSEWLWVRSCIIREEDYFVGN